MDDREPRAGSMRTRFLRVVNELRVALGYSLSESEPEFGEELVMEMMYGNFDFAVVHSLQYRAEAVLMECKFGPIPEGREEAILEKLLQMNTALAELDGSTFCIDPPTGNLIYTLPLPLENLDGDQLLIKMTEAVWHGRRWLETRFLAEASRGEAALVNPLQLA
jgi:hypothetical protein